MKRIIPKISSFFNKVYPVEIIFTVGILTLINYHYYRDDPGFLNLLYNPYIISILFFSIFYGKLSGIFTLILTLMAIIINSIIINLSSDQIQNLVHLYSSGDRYNSLVQFLFATFILSIIFGEIRADA